MSYKFLYETLFCLKTLLFENTGITGGCNCSCLHPRLLINSGLLDYSGRTCSLKSFLQCRNHGVGLSISVEGMALLLHYSVSWSTSRHRSSARKNAGKPGLSKCTLLSAWKKDKKPVDYLAQRSRQVTPNKTANFLISPLLSSVLSTNITRC